MFALAATAGIAQAAAPPLRWAADAEGNAPYIFQEPNNTTENIGFEVDIAKAIARILGRDAVFVQNQWDGLIPGLARNDYEIALNGIEITEDRRAEVDFSIPYYFTYFQLVVRAKTDDIVALKDVSGRTVGALKGSYAEKVLQNVPGTTVLTYEGELFGFGDLKNGRIDAMLCDAPIALFYASWNTDLKLVGMPIGEVSYGVAMRKNSKKLLLEINAALEEMKTSGELRRILNEWNLWNPMMSEYTNDHSPSMDDPAKYKKFIDDQLKEKKLEVIVNRYVSFLPILGQGALVTIGLSIVSMMLAVIVGLFIAITRVYAPRPISSLAIIYIEIIRGTPLLIQLLIIFYALPSIGIKLSPFIAAVIGLGLNYSAYEAENYRAGLFSVPKGQMEAAIALGFTKAQALRHIVVPQAIRLVLPPMTNDFISLLKDSSLVSVITMVELAKVYSQISSTYFDYLGTGIIVAVIYLLIGLPFVRLSKFVEGKFLFDKLRKTKEN